MASRVYASSEQHVFQISHVSLRFSAQVLRQHGQSTAALHTHLLVNVGAPTLYIDDGQ